MGAALRTEYRKLVTTRLWWILLLAMVGYMAFLSAIMAWGVTSGGGMAGAGEGSDDLALPPDAVVRAVYTIAVTFGYVFPLVVGALSVASEFRHQTITPTLLAEPRRSVVVGAKVLSGGALGLVFGVVGTAAAAGAGALVLLALGKPTFLDHGSTWQTLALSAAALALWAVAGVGFGAVLPNQVAVVVVVLAFTQFVEPVLRFVLAFTSWGEDVAKLLPGAAGEAMSGGSFYSESGLVELLEPWQGAVVLAAYGLGLAVIGRFTTFRRDIT
ncbi:ABC transporter permease [Cellulomonas fimi]|uniref:ABC transporter permease n=1 Tax=Cellulomonas fimi TaxID=1708 RepID=UPI00234C73C7|nr:ABC transporter permease [Cellulomonas fimi]MDC7123542.1 ABC transporter permease [Cellulomonas fimi]